MVLLASGGLKRNCCRGGDLLRCKCDLWEIIVVKMFVPTDRFPWSSTLQFLTQFTMCHSGWPFCTRLGLATGLVGRLPSRLLRYPRRGGLAGCLTWIGWLPPLRMRVDTVPYPHACAVSPPPKWPYIRRHIGLSQSVRVWQSVSPDSRVAHNPRPSWDFRLGLCLARSPLHRRIRLVLVVHLVVV